MNYLLVALSVLALLLGAGCGGDDDSTNGSDTGSATTETGTTDTEPPPNESESTVKPTKQKASPPSKGGEPEFGDRRNRVFRIAKDECGSQGPARLARRYDARSRNPADVAAAYAQKSYGPATRGAAYEGCVAGLEEGAPRP